MILPFLLLYAADFQTDGCSLFFDGSWRSCCVSHDYLYWRGSGLSHQDWADLELYRCLKIKAGPLLAELMYSSVRLGHYSPFKLKSKWNWGHLETEEDLGLPFKTTLESYTRPTSPLTLVTYEHLGLQLQWGMEANGMGHLYYQGQHLLNFKHATSTQK